MARRFEKISFTQFKKDINENIETYNDYQLPIRTTKYSAGYDFRAINGFTLKPGEIIKIPTGLKVVMEVDEMLMLLVRSSMGFKYNIRMCNQVGIIESDYYNNKENEGHMWVAIQNEGSQDYIIEPGDRYCQAIFTKFLTVNNETEIENTREGGLGSTGKGEKKNE